MKKAFFILSLLTITTFVACGPDAKQQAAEKKKSDSIDNKAGEDAAMDMLNSIDTTAKNTDTTKKSQEVKPIEKKN